MQNNLIHDSTNSIEKAVSLLREKKLVAIKTETVYGVACDPGSVEAIKKLYKLKNRPIYNPLIIHVNSINMAKEIAYVSKDSKKIIDNFWPGPLTLILPRKKNKLIHNLAISNLETIAVRQPKSKVMERILDNFKKPIAAPSANESGYVSATDAKHVIDSFGKRIDLVIDSGRTNYGLESTILDMTSNPYQIKRLGVIDFNAIKKITGISISHHNTENINSIKPNSPGQLLKHYSPKTPIKININSPNTNDAFLNFGKKNSFNHQPTLNLSESSDLYEAAYNLFYFLRKLDKLKKKRIVVAPIPNVGIGKTINERLYRASI